MCVSSFSPVQPSSIAELRTWLLRDSPVSHFPSQESKPEPTTSGICGQQRATLFAQYSLAPFCLKTCRDLFPADTLEPSLVTWPRWGTWGDGALLALPTPERRTVATDSGSWPTPRASTAMSAIITPLAIASTHKRFPNLETVVTARQWPTPTAHNAKECAPEFHRNTPTLAAQANGGDAAQPTSLNPAWVEWLMAWPNNWTSLKAIDIIDLLIWEVASGKTKINSEGKELPGVWWLNDPAEMGQRKVRLDIFQQNVLLDKMHDFLSAKKSISDGCGGPETRPEIIQSQAMREVRQCAISAAPQGQESCEQFGREYRVLVSAMSCFGAHTSWRLGQAANADKDLRDMQSRISAKKEGSQAVRETIVLEREGAAVRRTAMGVEDRVSRLTAIGNGQCSPVVARAWAELA